MRSDRSVLLRSASALVIGAAAWLGGATFAMAADAPGAAPAAAAGEASGEVTVTAGRRTENLQKVPVAVAAVGGAEIEKAGVQNFADLAKMTPSLSIITGVGGNNFINIRGVGIGVSTPFQSAGVPLHQDGLYLPHSEAFVTDAYFDLDHVEVYRGPQGTFAGQNSTGGAIFVTANQPSFAGPSAVVQQLVGNYNWYQTQLAVNMPIDDQWAARLALDFEKRDGFTKNIGAGNGALSATNGIPIGIDPSVLGQSPHRDLGNLDKLSVRAILRWKPTDNLDIRLRFDHLHDQSNGLATVRSTAGPSSYNDPSLITSPRSVYNDLPGWSLNRIDRVTLNIDWNINNDVELKSVSGYQHFYSAAFADSDNSSPYVFGCQAIVAGAVQPAVCAQGAASTLNTDTYWSQEFDLVSRAAGPLQWVVGVNGLHQDTPIHNYAYSYCTDPNVLGVSAAMGASPATNVCNTGLYVASPGAGLPANAAQTITSPGSLLDYLQSDQSAGLFGQVTYSFTDQWQLIVGGRVTYYEVQLNPGSAVRYAAGYNPNPNINDAYLTAQGITGAARGPSNLPFGTTNLQTCGVFPGSTNPPPPGFPTLPNLCLLSAKASYTQPTGRAVLNFFPTPNTTLYASVSSGFKQGAYTTQFTVQAPGPQPQYKQEDIYDYELGLKTVTLDGHLRLNANVYYEDYKNYQASFRIVGTIIPRSINIDDSRIYGLEADADLNFGDFKAAASVGYNNTKIQSNSAGFVIPASEYGIATPTQPFGPIPANVNRVDCAGAAPGSLGCENFLGEVLNYSPPWTANAMAQYDFHVMGGTLTPWVQVSYVGAQWDTLFHASQDYIPAHTLVDLRLVYQAPEHWRAEAFVTNVADTLWVSGVAGGASTTPFASLLTLGPPRQFGVRLQYTY
jgi:outer membrane receptor protein involved in Fe transport